MTAATLAPLVVLAALTCAEPLDPSTYHGTYPLRTVNASAVPVAVPALPIGCTEAFGAGTLTLTAGVFSLDVNSGFGCPGEGIATSYMVSIGGSLSGVGFPLVARAVDPMDSAGATMDMALSISGPDAILTIPAGAMKLAAAATLVFGPRQ